jgi:hypothetical protein
LIDALATAELCNAVLAAQALDSQIKCNTSVDE